MMNQVQELTDLLKGIVSVDPTTPRQNFRTLSEDVQLQSNVPVLFNTCMRLHNRIVLVTQVLNTQQAMELRNAKRNKFRSPFPPCEDSDDDPTDE